MNSENHPFYDILPEDSKGRSADNPHIFRIWSDEANPNHKKFPYIALCRDKMKGVLTWHMLCAESPFHEAVYEAREEVDTIITKWRGRALNVVELHWRNGNEIQHFVVEGKKPN